MSTRDAAIDRWCSEYADEVGGAGYAQMRGKCARAAVRLSLSFTELRVVKGHALTVWGEQQHWWCEDDAANLYDPTAAQFDGGVLAYAKYCEGDPVRVGKCMQCGDPIFSYSLEDMPARRDFCGDECAGAFAKDTFSDRFDDGDLEFRDRD
mgnify:FL=1